MSNRTNLIYNEHQAQLKVLATHLFNLKGLLGWQLCQKLF